MFVLKRVLVFGAFEHYAGLTSVSCFKFEGVCLSIHLYIPMYRNIPGVNYIPLLRYMTRPAVLLATWTCRAFRKPAGVTVDAVDPP